MGAFITQNTVHVLGLKVCWYIVMLDRNSPPLWGLKGSRTVSRRGLEVWRIDGDPAPLARDNIKPLLKATRARSVQCAMWTPNHYGHSSLGPKSPQYNPVSITTVDTPLPWTLFVLPSDVHISELIRRLDKQTDRDTILSYYSWWRERISCVSANIIPVAMFPWLANPCFPHNFMKWRLSRENRP